MEAAFFWSKTVWVKGPRADGRVDVNKGEGLVPNYRSRLVVCQLKATDQSGQNGFVSAPPSEALRRAHCMAMTRTGDHVPEWIPASPTRMLFSLVYVNHVYFNAAIEFRETATLVDLPQEGPGRTTMRAHLLRHLYGTRAAADGWQEEYISLLVDLGFKHGDASPNVLRHATHQTT